MRLGCGHTHFYSLFTLFSLDPKKVKKSRSHMKTFPTPPPNSLLNSNPQSAFHFFTFSLFFTLGKWGVVSGGPQRGSQLCKIPRNPLQGFCMLERTCTLGECLRRQGWHTWFTHAIYAALAGDDSPGRQCTDMMSHICVCQACTCGVPNVVKNVRQTENEMDSHRWNFLGLINFNLRSTCAQKRLSLHAWGHTLKWRQLMHLSHMHRGKKEVFECAPTSSLNFSSSCPDSSNGSGSIDCHARPCKP